jgi:hypothetical protein
MREYCNEQHIILCFNGPISRSLIEEIGNALKNYLQSQQENPSSSMDVFATYIEMSQNIRHYAAEKGYDEATASATLVVARNESGQYVVTAGNLVEKEDGEALLARIRRLADLDKAQLKSAYKDQLRAPRHPEAKTGAGLGLIDIARRAKEPLSAALRDHDARRSFFSLRAVI